MKYDEFLLIILPCRAMLVSFHNSYPHNDNTFQAAFSKQVTVSNWWEIDLALLALLTGRGLKELKCPVNAGRYHQQTSFSEL